MVQPNEKSIRGFLFFFAYERMMQISKNFINCVGVA